MAIGSSNTENDFTISTTKSMKVVLYLMILVFVVASSISSASLILGSGLFKTFD